MATVCTAFTCYYVRIFLLSDNVALLVIGFLQEGTDMCVTVDLVCPSEEMSSGTSYVIILDWNA